MIKKKIAALSAATMMLVAAFPAVGYANNHADTEFHFTMLQAGSKVYAAPQNREKEDASSVYMRCTAANKVSSNSYGNTYQGTAHGSMTSIGALADCIYYGKGSWTYSFVPGKSHYMVNYIKETGRTHANIQCTTKENVVNMRFSGLWSPDSING